MNHIGLHNSAEKPYACKHCGQEYLMKHNLMIHEKSHQRARQFECRYCAKRLFTKASLDLHLRASHADQWMQNLRATRNINNSNNSNTNINNNANIINTRLSRYFRNGDPRRERQEMKNDISGIGVNRLRNVSRSNMFGIASPAAAPRYPIAHPHHIPTTYPTAPYVRTYTARGNR